jgi:hypothetical protein
LFQIVDAIIAGVGKPELLPPPMSFAYSGSALTVFSTGSVLKCQIPRKTMKMSSDSSAARPASDTLTVSSRRLA